MANLKELRSKITVVGSTRKVVFAMKLVAGVKLRKAEQKALASREYSKELFGMISRLKRGVLDDTYELFSGRKNVSSVLLIIFASDKGLCGNFNYSVNKYVKNAIADLHAAGKKIHIMCVGIKLFELFKKLLNENDKIELVGDFYKNKDVYSASVELAKSALDYFYKGNVDSISVIYTMYYSAMKRVVETKSLIPIIPETNVDSSMTIFEPNPDEVLYKILPYNLGVQIYQCALESIASEQSSRMTSMDNAVRNADELLSNLTIKYNRTRQYLITQELVEVIAGADSIRKG